MAVKYDSILNKLREKDIIKQLDSDPSSPKSQDAWVLKTTTGGGTYKATLGLGFPYLSVGASAYKFSYRTKEGTTKRVTLT